MSPLLPSQDRWPMAGRSLAVLCGGLELLKELGQAEVSPGRVQACIIKV